MRIMYENMVSPRIKSLKYLCNIVIKVDMNNR